MKIAIHAADLDSERIDGTRVYIKNLLDEFGKISTGDLFVVGHRRKFNRHLEPKKYSNYEYFEKDFPFSWTQTRFAWEIWKRRPDVLWMPVHNLPFFRRKGLQTVVTVHDLAFKIFPEYFERKDLDKLNFLAGFSIKNADKLIAVSQSTKNDILKFYPEVNEEKIKVIHHGFDKNLFQKEVSVGEAEHFLKSHGLKAKSYLLYVGAIQPRKNLEVLVEAFEILKEKHPDLQLVLAGEKAWKWEGVIRKVEESFRKKDIVLLGKVDFEKLPILYKNAKVFVFPSLYEGFGIPILEAFASGVPSVLANNSSLSEIGGDCALYFDAESSDELSESIKKILSDERLAVGLVEKGLQRAKEFSWGKCARETLDYLK